MAPVKTPRCLREAWIAEQERLAKVCVDTDDLDWCVHGQFVQGLRHVAGVDVSFFPDGIHAVAAVVVLSYPDMEVVYEHCATFKLTVPYMPGFLAFREVPALKAMLEMVPSKWRPQAVLVDGNGVFHPRKCGSATHLGIVTGLPTIGVAKDVLQVGDVTISTAREIAKKLQGASDWAPLVGKGEDSKPLAALLRPGFGQKILVVSVGHKVSLSTAIALTASLCKASIPEPVRQADLRSRAAVRAWFAGTSVRKLRMAKQQGAGDLLQIVSSEMEELMNGTWDSSSTGPEPKRPLCGESHKEGCARKGLSIGGLEASSREKSRKHVGKTSKAKMVWRIKSVPNDSAAAVLGRETSTMPDSQADSYPTTSIAKLGIEPIPSQSLSLDTSDDGGWSLGIFLRQYLCGLCIVRVSEDL